MLSVKVVDAIIKTGDFFEGELDFEERKVALTNESREWFTKNLGVKNIGSEFMEFYSLFVGGCGPREEADPIFTLDELLESNENPYWEQEYTGFGKKYLQLTSIEGEHSLFYAKETDKVYGASWEEMGDLANETLPETFENFHVFLEWYFNV